MMVLDPTGQRQLLIDAVHSAVGELLSRGYADDMVGICAGGLIFLLSGEDGEPWSDEDIQFWLNDSDTLKIELYDDIRSAWQGFNSDEEREAAETIAKTVTKYFVEAVRG